MTKHDSIISGLMDALDKIRREAEKSGDKGSCAYIAGAAAQAMANCDAHRERNSDGYLVVRSVSSRETFAEQAARLDDERHEEDIAVGMIDYRDEEG